MLPEYDRSVGARTNTQRGLSGTHAGASRASGHQACGRRRPASLPACRGPSPHRCAASNSGSWRRRQGFRPMQTVGRPADPGAVRATRRADEARWDEPACRRRAAIRELVCKGPGGVRGLPAWACYSGRRASARRGACRPRHALGSDSEDDGGGARMSRSFPVCRRPATVGERRGARRLSADRCSDSVAEGRPMVRSGLVPAAGGSCERSGRSPPAGCLAGIDGVAADICSVLSAAREWPVGLSG